LQLALDSAVEARVKVAEKLDAATKRLQFQEDATRVQLTQQAERAEAEKATIEDRLRQSEIDGST